MQILLGQDLTLNQTIKKHGLMLEKLGSLPKALSYGLDPIFPKSMWLQGSLYDFSLQQYSQIPLTKRGEGGGEEETTCYEDVTYACNRLRTVMHLHPWMLTKPYSASIACLISETYPVVAIRELGCVFFTMICSPSGPTLLALCWTFFKGCLSVLRKLPRKALTDKLWTHWAM
jgi:hypothetical protein